MATKEFSVPRSELVVVEPTCLSCGATAAGRAWTGEITYSYYRQTTVGRTRRTVSFRLPFEVSLKLCAGCIDGWKGKRAAGLAWDAALARHQGAWKAAHPGFDPKQFVPLDSVPVLAWMRTIVMGVAGFAFLAGAPGTMKLFGAGFLAAAVFSVWRLRARAARSTAQADRAKQKEYETKPVQLTEAELGPRPPEWVAAPSKRLQGVIYPRVTALAERKLIPADCTPTERYPVGHSLSMPPPLTGVSPLDVPSTWKS